MSDVDVLDPDIKKKDKAKKKNKEPKMFKVLFLNDDFTPMDFVIKVLMKFHAKSDGEATKIMLDVHHKGVGVAGVYTMEIAETKVEQVNSVARSSGFPLKSTMEEN